MLFQLASKQMIFTIQFEICLKLNIKYLYKNDTILFLQEVNAAKIYFAYNYAWWHNLQKATKYAVSMTPLRQSYDFGVSKITSKGVLNVGYSDGGNKHVFVSLMNLTFKELKKMVDFIRTNSFRVTYLIFIIR